MPRIPSFLLKQPEIDVFVASFLQRNITKPEDADFWICHWPAKLHCQADTLMEEEIMPVCSPALAETYGDLSVHSLRHLPLIHIDRSELAVADDTSPDWNDYLREYGIRRNDTAKGLRFSQARMAIDAAKAGMGALLGGSILIEKALEKGELVRIGDSYPVRIPLFSVLVLEAQALPEIAKFKEWLFEQVHVSNVAATVVQPNA